MEDACHRLQKGERLTHQNMTTYRYYCMATLMVTHRKPEKSVVDFKVSVHVFQCSYQPATLTLVHFKSFVSLCKKSHPPSQVTEWNDRQVSTGGGATIQIGMDRALISIEEDRVSRAFWGFFYIQMKKPFPQMGFHSLAFRFPSTVAWCLLHGHQAALPEETRGSRR